MTPAEQNVYRIQAGGEPHEIISRLPGLTLPTLGLLYRRHQTVKLSKITRASCQDLVPARRRRRPNRATETSSEDDDGRVVWVSVTTNALTGLEQTHNNYFDVPWVRQKSVESLRLDGHDSALHRVPSHGEFTIDFFAKLLPANELVVTFHGANMARHSYPRFERIQSFRAAAPALLAFADPTLMYRKGLLLTWYVGGPGWDPAREMVEIVRQAMAVCGATHVLFVGGSGGGHPALRLSAMMDSSTAFVQSPTTDIENSIPGTVEQYFKTVWPGRERRQVIEGDPTRFSMPALYGTRRPQNKVYYLQNLNDPTFIKEHYRPLKNVYLDAGAPCGTSADGSKQFALYDSELERHGPPTPSEFNHHLQQARKLREPVTG